MLPLKEEFIGEVNTAQGFLIVSPPDYLDAGDKDE
jgi:hypothetical protein